MKCFRIFMFWIIPFSIILSSCTSTSIAKSTSTPSITPSNTAYPTKSSTPQSTATPNASGLAIAYLDGEINDVSYMTIEERTDFSEALVDELNARRGDSPLIYNNEAYFDPDSLRMKKLDDGSTPEEQTIQLYLPVSEDDDGNLLIKYKGEWKTISNSATVDWAMIVTDPYDERMDWPNTETGPNGLTDTQYFLTIKSQFDGSQAYIIKPVIILDTTMGQIYLEGTPPGPGGHIGPGIENTMKMATIITDDFGTPIAAMQSIFLAWGSKYLEENSVLEISDGYGFDEDGKFAKSLRKNQTYYLLLAGQEFTFEHGIGVVLNGWTGLEIADEESDFFDSTATTNDGLFIIYIHTLIKRVNR